jgi:alcohol dehydrogenase class IV
LRLPAPAVLEVNIGALKKKNQATLLARFGEAAKILTGEKSATADDAIFWAKTLILKLQIPSLSDFGLSTADFPILAEKAKNSSSMKGNPVELNNEQLFTILEKSL